MSTISKAELDAALKTLQDNTSIQVISNFLKAHGFTWSATSWDALINQRLIPPIKTGALDRVQLIELLRSVEEHGRQHVLLFKIQKHIAQQLMNEGRVTAALKKFDV